MFRKWIATLAAVTLVALQLFPSVTLAWSGNSWDGNPWEGNSWEGESFEGVEWSGNPTQGNDWTGKNGDGHPSHSNGNSWNGTNPQGDVPLGPGNGWEGTPSQGNPFEGNGHQTQGSPGIDGFQGQDYRGYPNSLMPLPTSDGSSNGNGFPPAASRALSDSMASATTYTKASASKPDGWDVTKFLVDDIGMGTVDLVAELASTTDATEALTSYSHSRMGLALAGFNLVTKGHEGAQTAGDAATIAFDTYNTVDSFNKFNQLGLGQAGSEASMLSQAGNATRAAAPTISTLAKVNAITGVVGLGFSTYDFVNNVSDARNSTGTERTDSIIDSVGSVGSMLMSGGAIATAIPGGQAVGLGLMAVGGAISLGTAAVKFFRREPVQKAIKKGAEAVSKGWKKVTGFLGFGS